MIMVIIMRRGPLKTNITLATSSVRNNMMITRKTMMMMRMVLVMLMKSI